MSKWAGASIGAPRIEPIAVLTRAPPADLAAPRPRRTDQLLRLSHPAWRRACPSCFIAGRIYGSEALGPLRLCRPHRPSCGAQLATLGLKRGFAQQLAHHGQRIVCMSLGRLAVAAVGSALCMGLLMLFPQAMFPKARSRLEWLLPITIIALAWSDIMLAALAYRHDVTSTVRARAIVEADHDQRRGAGLGHISNRDGLIIAYVLSMVAARSLRIPFVKIYGMAPHAWAPIRQRSGEWPAATYRSPPRTAGLCWWGSRRIEHSGAGDSSSHRPWSSFIRRAERLFRSRPSSNQLRPDPGAGHRQQLKERRQGSRRPPSPPRSAWVIAAKLGVALALASRRGCHGLVGPAFVSRTAALAFLLAAEVVAAMAAVSEAGSSMSRAIATLRDPHRHARAGSRLAVCPDLGMREFEWPVDVPGGPVRPLACCSRLDLRQSPSRDCGAGSSAARVNGWRWPLIWAPGGNGSAAICRRAPGMGGSCCWVSGIRSPSALCCGPWASRTRT